MTEKAEGKPVKPVKLERRKTMSNAKSTTTNFVPRAFLCGRHFNPSSRLPVYQRIREPGWIQESGTLRKLMSSKSLTGRGQTVLATTKKEASSLLLQLCTHIICLSSYI